MGSNPGFSIFRTKVQRFADLEAVERHNTRVIRVPGADPAIENGARTLRMTYLNAYLAVVSRIVNAGAKRPGAGRVVAFECIFTFSPEANPMPSFEELEARGTAFLDRIFGQENVVAIWEHRDEKTPHLHALVVPVCSGRTPGVKPNDERYGKELVVSWNQFSGSHERVFRKKENDLTAPKTGSETPKKEVRNNKVMEGWQTEWAKVWEDFGLKRGLKSSRKHLRMKWVNGELGKIKEQAAVAVDGLANPSQWLSIPDEEAALLKAQPTLEVLGRIFEKHVMPKVSQAMLPLQELAARGIQLDAEKQARSDLGEENAKLKEELSQLRSKAIDPAYLVSLEEQNAGLKKEAEQLREAALRPDPARLLDQLKQLSDGDIEALLGYERDRRNRLTATSGVMVRPPLNAPQSGPTPVPGTEPRV